MSDFVSLQLNHLSKSKDVWHIFHYNAEDFFYKVKRFIYMQDNSSQDIPRYFIANL